MINKLKLIPAISYSLLAISYLSGCLTLDSSTKQNEVAQIRSSVSEELIKVKQEVNSLKGQMEELEYKIDKIQQTQSQQSNELNTTLKEWRKNIVNDIEKKQAQDKKELLDRTNIIAEEVSKENKELRSQIESIKKSPQEGYYVVTQGDTLSKIAQMFGVSVKSLMEVNGITDPNSIRVGQRLVIPEKE